MDSVEIKKIRCVEMSPAYENAGEAWRTIRVFTEHGVIDITLVAEAAANLSLAGVV